VEEDPALVGAPVSGGRKRERSRIQFPYNDLDEVVKLARAVHDTGGSRATLEQIVKPLGHDNISSGAFRLKLSAARMYGLIDFDGQEVRLTELGRRVVQADTEAAARADAFLTVPLYQEVYDKYKGYALPRDVGLESEMEALGVSKNTRSKARQIFQRAARQAGFFGQGKDRLVAPFGAPITKPLDPKKHDDQPNGATPNGGSGGGGSDGEGATYYKQPLMGEYLKTMPPVRPAWEEEALDEWVETFKRIVRTIDSITK
jgi:hypothetical protein